MDSIGSFYVENGIDPYDPDELDNWVSYSQDPLGELIRLCYRGTKRRRKSQSYSSVRNTKPVLAMLTCKFGADCRNLKKSQVVSTIILVHLDTKNVSAVLCAMSAQIRTASVAHTIAVLSLVKLLGKRTKRLQIPLKMANLMQSLIGSRVTNTIAK